ncbi:hypothetical protein K439DRAFT_1623452 [Ramaria rubella]|nr:hypothetical protein K439DRAFT_1623452 [Ramaria rubella]
MFSACFLPFLETKCFPSILPKFPKFPNPGLIPVVIRSLFRYADYYTGIIDIVRERRISCEDLLDMENYEGSCTRLYYMKTDLKEKASESKYGRQSVGVRKMFGKLKGVAEAVAVGSKCRIKPKSHSKAVPPGVINALSWVVVSVRHLLLGKTSIEAIILAAWLLLVVFRIPGEELDTVAIGDPWGDQFMPFGISIEGKDLCLEYDQS